MIELFKYANTYRTTKLDIFQNVKNSNGIGVYNFVPSKRTNKIEIGDMAWYYLGLFSSGSLISHTLPKENKLYKELEKLYDSNKPKPTIKTMAEGGWVLVDGDTERKIGEYETESEARQMMYEYEGNSTIIEKSKFNSMFVDGGSVAEEMNFFVVNNKDDKNYSRVGYVLDETKTITDKEGNEFEKLNFENQKVAKKYNVKDLIYLEQRDTFTQKDKYGGSDTEYVILVNYQYSSKPFDFYYYLYNVTKKFVATEGNLDWVKSNLPRGFKVYSSYDNGGGIPHEDEMFHLPLEMVVYVPSTQDVDKVISVDEMDKRVNEVKEYLASKFGGYSSADKLGGFVDSNGKLVNEDVVQVVSFATTEAFESNKEELVSQLSKWGKEWGQEAIGFEFEGDLYYVPQEGDLIKKTKKD